jgi:hypothetical protein
MRGREIAAAILLGALLGGARAARAGDSVDCKVTVAGKSQVKTVKSIQECERLGGKVVKQIYCEVQKGGGKTETGPVASPQACRRLGGSVVQNPKGKRPKKSFE